MNIGDKIRVEGEGDGHITSIDGDSVVCRIRRQDGQLSRVGVPKHRIGVTAFVTPLHPKETPAAEGSVASAASPSTDPSAPPATDPSSSVPPVDPLAVTTPPAETDPLNITNPKESLPGAAEQPISKKGKK